MNTIYSLIHRNLKRTLAASLAAAVLVLCIYSFLSFRKVESQAIKFVTNHIQALAQAGVNSQNINEIDKEINRFVQTWKETQDLDLRVDIFLNEKMIAHGGQLQPFRRLFSRSEKIVRLPSGEDMSIVIEIGLQNFIVSAFYLFTALSAFVLAAFFVLMSSMRKSIKSITSPLETRIAWLKSTARDLPNSAWVANPNEKSSDILEIDELSLSISTLLTQIGLLEGRLTKDSFNRGRIKMAEQVAHTIKGTIGTLQLKLSSSKSLTAKEKLELTESINSLREISLGLLKSEKVGGLTATAAPTDQLPRHVLPILKSIVSAKRIQSAAFGKNILFCIENEALTYPNFCSVKSGDLETIIANLLDNAMDAIQSEGIISISCIAEDQDLKFTVTDNGRGIPPHLLPLLMQDGATFGKLSGNGIGLCHIKEILESKGGSIFITSIENQGTTVHFSIPRIASPKGFTESVDFPEGSTVVVIDDDPLIAEAWKIKFSLHENVITKDLVSITSASEFREWIQENGHEDFGQRVYLFDYDLKDQNATGLSLIEEHGLNFESILVSGMVDTEEVSSHASRIGVKFLSKEFLEIVPLTVSGGMAKEATLLGAV